MTLTKYEIASLKPDDHQESHRPAFPDRKISETILDFAAPYLDLLPPTATDKDVEQVLGLAYVAWNAVILAEAKGNASYLGELKSRVAEHPESAAIVDSLILRKRDLFADDMRLIGDFKVSRRNGSLHLWAEARSPFNVE